ncbi:MAG: prepilin-type N-terminal cleavage/methylation domain-containing protein [Gemmatimonadetes bacterium]|nr:prepilin-type N-terminal cleavage/methylation domain-containing protein [Gemmatimonadota bacterium]
MTRSGFTLLEVITSIVIMGILSALGLPRFQEWMGREKVRQARREVTVHLAGARAVGAHRGCNAVLHLDDTSDRVWVTACQVQGGGIDTVGMVNSIAERYGVSFETDGDSIQFTPQGLSFGSSWITVKFTKDGYEATLEISPVGKAEW